MGIKRPIKTNVLRQYGSEIMAAEQNAKRGYDPKTKKLDESVYGPTNVKFDIGEDLEFLKQQGLAEDVEIESNTEEPIFNEEIETNNEMDNFKMTEQLKNEEIEEKTQEEIEEQVQQFSDDPELRLKQVAETLKLIVKNPPTEQELRRWKAMHGNIFILNIEENLFIYRYLKRQEWVQMQVNESFQKMRQDQKESVVFNRCVLWPKLSPENEAMLPAGAISLIVEQINLQSLFLDPHQVANITIKI